MVRSTHIIVGVSTVIHIVSLVCYIHSVEHHTVLIVCHNLYEKNWILDVLRNYATDGGLTMIHLVYIFNGDFVHYYSYWDHHRVFGERSQILTMITARKSSCLKVMFSQSCVCSQGGYVKSHALWNRPHGIVHPPDMGPRIPLPSPLPCTPPSGHRTWNAPSPPLVTFGGHHWRPVQTCSLWAWGHTHPVPWCWHLVVATEAGSTHPTGMLSCSSQFCYRPPGKFWNQEKNSPWTRV